MVMVIIRFTEFVFHIGPIPDFKDDSQGLEKIEASIDGGKTDLSLLFIERMVDFLRTQWGRGGREFLIDQEPGMAQSEMIFPDEVFKYFFIHGELDRH